MALVLKDERVTGLISVRKSGLLRKREDEPVLTYGFLIFRIPIAQGFSSQLLELHVLQPV